MPSEVLGVAHALGCQGPEGMACVPSTEGEGAPGGFGFMPLPLAEPEAWLHPLCE